MIRPAQPDTLCVPVEFKSIDDAGRFVGYAAAFATLDLLDDIILPGAFADTIGTWTIRGTWPRVRWHHGDTIGHVTAMAEDDTGLRVEGQLWIDDGAIAELRDLIRSGQKAPGLSFGFHAVEADLDGNVRTIRRLELIDDITLTWRPVNPATQLVEMKGLRLAETSLRDAGFSRRQAKAIVADGYRAIRQRDADAEMLAAGLQGLLTTLRTINHQR